MADITRTDRNLFSTKEDAINFARTHKLYGRGLFLSKSGVYTIKRFTKTGEKKVGCFMLDPDHNNIIFVDYQDITEIPGLKRNKPHGDYGIKPGHKAINGNKLMNYIIDNCYDKRLLCALVHKSRSFINDSCRYNRMDILCLETICDYMKVPRDYFDPVPEPEPELKPVETVSTATEEEISVKNDIHDDLMVLIASSKRLEALMMEMIEMWRN